MPKLIITIIVILFLNNGARAQFNHYEKQAEIQYGFVFKDEGIGIAAGGRYYLNREISIIGNIQYEWARPFQAYYSNLGLDLGLNYSALEIGRNMYFNLKLLGSATYQKLTDKNLINESVFNPGGKAGAGLEYYFNDGISAELYGLQGFYSNKLLGQKTYDIGVQFKILL